MLLAGIFATALAFAAPAADSKDHFPRGIVMSICAPNDGPAISLVLAAKSPACGGNAKGPQLRLSLWEPGLTQKLKAGAEFVIDGTHGHATLCSGAEPPACEELRSLRLKVRKVEQGKELSGHLEGEAKSGVPLPAQDFEATWCENKALCG